MDHLPLEAFRAATEFCEDKRELYRLSFAFIKEVIHPEAISLLCYNAQKKELTFDHTERIGRNVLKGVSVPLDRGFAGWVATHKEPLMVNNPYDDPRFLDQLDKITRFRTRNILAVPLVTEDGKFLGVAEVLNKLDEQSFSDKDLEYLQELARDAVRRIVGSESKDHPEVLHQLQTNLGEHLQVEAASILLFDARKNQLVFFSTENREYDKLKNVRLPVGEGLAGWVAEHRQPIKLDDAYEDLRFFHAVDRITRFRTKAVMVVPLLHNDQLFGVLQVMNPIDQKVFSDEHFSYTRELAAILAARMSQMNQDCQENS